MKIPMIGTHQDNNESGCGRPAHKHVQMRPNVKTLKKWQDSPNYLWVIVSVCCLMVLTVLGFCSSSKSIYISPVCEALGISRSAFSVNDSCRYIATSVINIFFGALIAKFGAKKLICAGFASLIISMLIYSCSTNVLGFYAGGVFLGIGLSWTTTTMVGSVINKWCPKNKGTIMGIVLASNGIGATIAMQILTPIIYNESNPFGYRSAYRIVALILLAVAIIMAIFFKNTPAKIPDHHIGSKKATEKNEFEGEEYSEILKKPHFYIAAVCIFFTGMILQGISGIGAPHLSDSGLHSSFVATALSIHSIVLTVSKFSTGFMYDRTGIKITSAICFVCGIAGMIFLLNVSPTATGKAFAMAYGVLSSFALPLETIMLPIYARELFGEKSFNRVLGIFVSVNTAGYAVGAPVANVCYDILGSYDLSIIISCILLGITAIVMQGVINKSHKERV